MLLDLLFSFLFKSIIKRAVITRKRNLQVRFCSEREFHIIEKQILEAYKNGESVFSFSVTEKYSRPYINFLDNTMLNPLFEMWETGFEIIDGVEKRNFEITFLQSHMVEV